MRLRNARLGGAFADVTLDGERIASVAPAGTTTVDGETVDLDGRWLLPGLWDSHVHLTQWALTRQRVDLSSATSAAEAAALVRAAATQRAERADTDVLVGRGFRDGLWPDTPTRELLDEAAPGLLVVLVSADIHACWLSSAALERFGHPGSTGLLREDDCFAVVRDLDRAGEHLHDDWVREAAEAAARRGVVGITDLEMTWNRDVWLRRMSAGFDALRVRFGIYPQHLDRALGEGMRTGQRLAPLLEVGPFKIITDGSLNTRTAFCADPYPGVHDHPYGLLTVPPDDLAEWLRRAAGGGLVPAVHAIGDEANRFALDAFERVGVGGRIEHAQLLHERDFARFATLGVEASVQPEHAMDDRDVAERYWADRTARSFALRTLLDAGARLRLGSDAPVAPLDPWITIAAAVGRARDGREPWHPEQAITPGEALTASTDSGIAAGAPADLVVVDRDPLQAEPERLRSMPVAATVVQGRFTHTSL
ncbi:amidohydrolase family protein [Lysobacter korlensis]|uniref:Amidohydrolase family protein n=1 Tax=Lysobacter korlensis TaxID=553636 RepID=A0ABV6RN37_9GAMM